MANPISPKIRTANGKKIMAMFPMPNETVRLQRSAIFALQAVDGVDDRFILGPYSRPTMIESISFVSALEAAATRTFSLHCKSNPSNLAPTPNDVNLLDPQSPSSVIMPGRTYITLPIRRRAPFQKFWIQLSRFKGGSTTFEMTCWVYLRQGI